MGCKILQTESTFVNLHCTQALLQTVSWTNFTGLGGGMLSWWLATWLHKVNIMFRILQCQFMLRNVCVCLVEPEFRQIQSLFPFFLLRLLFSRIIRQITKPSMARAEVSRITAAPLAWLATAVWLRLPALLASVSKPQCQCHTFQVRLG